MPRTPKPTDHMDTVKHLMGTMPDHEVAALCNSTPSIVGRYRRRYGIPAYEGYKFGMGQEPPSKKGKDGEEEEVAAPVAAAPRAAEKVAEKPAKESTKSRSKLDAFRDVIGTLSDADVAGRAGVTAEAVRIYRRRHGLSSRRENAARAEAEAAAKASATAAAKAPAAKAPVAVSSADADDKKSPQRRSSKLDSYMDLVGTLPDREVATMAGVTPENVRAFRRRHDISARWRDDEDVAVAAPVVEAPKPAAPAVEAPKAEAPKATKTGKAPKTAKAAKATAPVAEAPKAAPPVASAPKAEAPKAPAPKAEAPKAAAPAVDAPKGALQGYAVHVRVGDTTHEYLIVASDIASAATNAIKAVSTRHASAEITSLRHLGAALA